MINPSGLSSITSNMSGFMCLMYIELECFSAIAKCLLFQTTLGGCNPKKQAPPYFCDSWARFFVVYFDYIKELFRLICKLDCYWWCQQLPPHRCYYISYHTTLEDWIILVCFIKPLLLCHLAKRLLTYHLNIIPYLPLLLTWDYWPLFNRPFSIFCPKGRLKKDRLKWGRLN